MNKKIRNIQNKYIPFLEEYRWLDSYADEIWEEAQKDLLEELIKFEEQIGKDKYVKSSYLRIKKRSLK